MPSRMIVIGLPADAQAGRVRESRRPVASRHAGDGASPEPVRPRRPAGMLIVVFGLVAVLGAGLLGGVAARRQQAVSERPSAPVAQSNPDGPVPHPRPAVSPVPASSAVVAQPSATPSYGTLRITTVPSGARVDLDGKAVGVTALTLTTVPAGRRLIKVSRSGFKSEMREVDVSAGEVVTVDLTLAPLPSPPPVRRHTPSAPLLPPLPLPPPPP
ncbi:MAG: PEGA domain-containing protein [Armatimonadota bacterium]|nr:PEGA domain-containing protein [Armatimonadota bacterium]